MVAKFLMWVHKLEKSLRRIEQWSEIDSKDPSYVHKHNVEVAKVFKAHSLSFSSYDYLSLDQKNNADVRQALDLLSELRTKLKTAKYI
jgi:hypothetical protein